ncbi:MAG TPA: sialidase family protein [Lysobacter sp.]
MSALVRRSDDHAAGKRLRRSIAASLQAVLCVTLALAAGCKDRATPEAASASPAWQEWRLPVDAAQQPDLAAAPDGSLLLSWIEGDSDAQHLRFARWRDGRWTAPQSIVMDGGIGNVADMPHVRQTEDGALWATWLRRVGDGHARDLVLARSADDGRTWSAPQTVNLDGTATEHGFASLWPEGRDAIGVAWLDGRETGEHAMHGMQAGATMLRTAVFDARLSRRDEQAIDTGTCDCCQTDVAVVDDAPLLVYRDRLPGEVRDIALLRRDTAGWSAPRRLHADGWAIDACPVNGPAIAARGRDVSVAWYTMQATRPTLRYAASRDGGVHFDPPIDLAAGDNVLGRVDVAREAGGAWVLWLEEDTNGQSLRIARIADGAAHGYEAQTIARLAGRGRGTGWPRLVSMPEGSYAVWTDVIDGVPHLRGRQLR